MLKTFYTRFNKQLPNGLLLKYLSLLPLNLREKNRKFIRWQDRHANLFGKLLLFNGLLEYGYSEDILGDIKYNQFGRPYINGNIDFNISHSGEFVICTIGEKIKLGVDIEEVKDLDFTEFKQVMSSEQWAIITNSINPQKAFFKFWTLKESVIKADNRGLSIPLLDIHVNNDIVLYDSKIWYLQEFQLDNNYCSCLATNIPGKKNILLQIDFYEKGRRKIGYPLLC